MDHDAITMLDLSVPSSTVLMCPLHLLRYGDGQMSGPTRHTRELCRIDAFTRMHRLAPCHTYLVRSLTTSNLTHGWGFTCLRLPMLVARQPVRGLLRFDLMCPSPSQPLGAYSKAELFGSRSWPGLRFRNVRSNLHSLIVRDVHHYFSAPASSAASMTSLDNAQQSDESAAR